MHQIVLLTFLLFLSPVILYAQTISGVVNSYASVTGITGNVISVGNHNGTLTHFEVGDKVLVIQMKGATINSSNNSGYGTVSSYGNAGNYEFVTITARTISSGNLTSVTVTSLTRTYTSSAAVQLVSVPQYNDVTVTGTVTAVPWSAANGYGGIVTFEVSDTLTLAGNISVNGLGFSGGAINATANGNNADSSTYTNNSASGHGRKGEGVTNTPANNFGRGALANAGGGGNVHNAGGGGGGNFAAGGGGGWGYNHGGRNCGGVGGKALTYSAAANKIFMGGGGGSGQQNNNVSSAGANGGGIILIRAKDFVVACPGSYTISANGNNALNTTGNDGAGGGGGAGVVYMDVSYWNQTCSFTIELNGGDGGSVNNSGQHGGGGGGSTGIALFANQPLNNYSIIAVEGSAGNDCSSCTVNTASVGGSCGTCTQQGWNTSGGMVLPVTVVSFSGQPVNGASLLKWEVVNESSIQKYILERSSDGKAFSLLKEQPARNLSERHTYQVTDQNPLTGDNYYRLTVMHADDSRSTQGTVILAFRNSKPDFTFHPNPAGESVTINSLPGASISIFDAKGMLMMKEVLPAGSGQIDISRLAPGIYRVLNFHSEHISSAPLVVF